jgi:putative protease
MELLAPAGTLPAFEAALQEGADAVYIGAPGLNARALARDFSFNEIAAMVQFAHAREKKLYVAMNSLMKESEVRLALETLAKLAKIGPDALILQDLGVLHLVRRFFPDFTVHASTLMTVNTASAANYLKSMGFQRIVLARELSLDEIGAIHRRSEVDLEIFIHGAMCFSYSGLCRFSSLHGGKSSLRGQCVQPCRRRYDWVPSGKRTVSSNFGKGGGYLFSMNDLSGIDHLAAVKASGVVCLKIEGRLKSVEYVRNAVRAYRLALDALDVLPGQRQAMLEAARQCLEDAMGRKRSTGFFITGREGELIVPRLSGSTGEVIGKVVRVEEPKGKWATAPASLHVVLQSALTVGDRLRLYDERTGDRKSFTLRSLEVKGKKVEQGQPGQTVAISLAGIELGRLLHKSFQGVLFRVDVSGRAEKQKSTLLRSVATVQLPPLDPSVVDKMMTALSLPVERGGDGKESQPSRQQKKVRVRLGESSGPEWWIKVPSLEAFGQRYPFKVAKILIDLSRRNLAQYLQYRQRKNTRQTPLIWALPPIISEEQLAWYQEAVELLQQQGASRFQISHLGQLTLFTTDGRLPSPDKVKLYGDSTCNVLNSPALQAWAAQGMAGMQFSLETDQPTLNSTLAHFSSFARTQGEGKRMQVGLQLYGRPPLFTARLDAPHFQGQRSLVSSRSERFYLDRGDEVLYVRPHAAFSLLQFAGELTKSGLDYFVVDVSQGQLKKECAEVTALLSGRGDLPDVFSGNYAGILS